MRRFRHRRRRTFALALLSTTLIVGSTPILAAETSPRQATISSKKEIPFGKRTVLRGKFPDAPRAAVDILRRTSKDDSLRQVGSVRTNDEGVWKTRVRPRRTAVWRARLAATEPEEPATGSEDGREASPEPLAAPIDRESNKRRILVRSKTKVRPAKRHVVAGNKVKIKGQVLPKGTPRKVKVKVGSRRITTRANRRGRFSVRWKAPGTGGFRVKAFAKRNRDSTASKDRGGRITAYRYAHASWYGPGFYGRRTACGQTLTTSTRGVAHKSMPCGTKLKLRYGSRTVTVRVIDRGPYIAGREFDLTQATKNDLGFGSTGTVLSSR